MADYTYTPSPTNVGRFLKHIQDAGVPPKVTQKHLESVGFKGKNDRYLIGVLKFIGFLDGSGSPTSIWKGYKDKSKAKQVLAGVLRESYSDLFSTYPDAYRKDNEALHNYFASQTGLAKVTVDRMVGTFKILCESADFDEPQPPAGTASTNGASLKADPPVPAPQEATAFTTPAVHINIELHLPPTADASVYEKLFAAMKKHLIS